MELRWDQVTAIFLADDVNNTDAFRMMRALRAEGSCVTLSVCLLHPDSPTRLIKSADVVLDGQEVRKSVLNTWSTHGQPRHWQPSIVTHYLWTPSTGYVTRMSLVERVEVEMQLQRDLHRLRRTERRLHPISSDKLGTFCPS
jgi:hypothetical protein